MTWESEIEAIETRFNTEWAAGPNTPIRFENDPRSAPTSGEWVECVVIPATAERSTLGIRNHRYTGFININIYVSKGTGTNRARVLADTAAAIFRDQQFSGIVCRSPDIVIVGDVNGFYQINVSAPYWRDYVFS